MKPELLETVKNLTGISRIKYISSTLFKGEKRLFVHFVSAIACEETDVKKVEKALIEYLPKGYIIEVRIEKLVADENIIAKFVASCLREEFIIVCSNVTEECAQVEIKDDLCNVEITLEGNAYDYVSTHNIEKIVTDKLEMRFPNTFSVKVKKGETEIIEYSDLQQKTVEEEPVELVMRKLKVDDVTRFFDNDTTDEATYICDTRGFVGEVYLAGVISAITEKHIKADKDDKEDKNKNQTENTESGVSLKKQLKDSEDRVYYIIEINDRTGRVSGTIFPSKDKIKKIEKLAVDSEVIMKCEYTFRNGYINLRIKSINLCSFPKNFVPVPRPKRPVPKFYKLVKPDNIVLESQQNFLVDNSVPECFNDRSFVVFDLETTGTDLVDKITEIGAVRIENGKFTEYFETLVNPKKHIPKEVVNITGIDDDTVKDAPLFKDVCPDFYKFCDGATLVAHNMDFDSRFIKRESTPLDFVFDHPLMDTLAIAREVLPGLPHYRLNDLCERYNIEFRHHRAYSDALATAQLFIELIRLRKNLD